MPTTQIFIDFVGQGNIRYVSLALQGLSLNQKFGILTQMGCHNDTALIRAADKGQTQIVDMLMAGLNANQTYQLLTLANKAGYTALTIAAHQGHFAIVQRLLKELSVEQKLALISQINDDRARDGALILAIGKGCTQTVEALLADLNIEQKLWILGQTDILERSSPLILSASYGHAKIIEVLLQDIETQDKATLLMKTNRFGYTTLMLASVFCQTTAVEMLFEHLTDIQKAELIIQEETTKNMTAIELAYQYGKPTMVSLLQSFGAVLPEHCIVQQNTLIYRGRFDSAASQYSEYSEVSQHSEYTEDSEAKKPATIKKHLSF